MGQVGGGNEVTSQQLHKQLVVARPRNQGPWPQLAGGQLGSRAGALSLGPGLDTLYADDLITPPFLCTGVLVDLHDSPRNSSTACTQINMEAVQQVLAAKWAVDVINNQSLPHELKIGEKHGQKKNHILEPKSQVYKSTTRAAVERCSRRNCSS